MILRLVIDFLGAPVTSLPPYCFCLTSLGSHSSVLCHPTTLSTGLPTLFKFQFLTSRQKAKTMTPSAIPYLKYQNCDVRYFLFIFSDFFFTWLKSFLLLECLTFLERIPRLGLLEPYHFHLYRGSKRALFMAQPGPGPRRIFPLQRCLQMEVEDQLCNL